MKLRATASATNENGVTFTLRREEGKNCPASLDVRPLNAGCRVVTFENFLYGLEDLEECGSAIDKFLASELGEDFGERAKLWIRAEDCLFVSTKSNDCWVFAVPGGYLSRGHNEQIWFYYREEDVTKEDTPKPLFTYRKVPAKFKPKTGPIEDHNELLDTLDMIWRVESVNSGSEWDAALARYGNEGLDDVIRAAKSQPLWAGDVLEFAGRLS